MNISLMPFWGFLLGIAFAVLFETAMALVERWVMIYEREVGAALYWVAIGIVGWSCHLMNLSREMGKWAPFMFVAACHIMACLAGHLPLSRRYPPSSGSGGRGSGGITSSRSSSTQAKGVRKE